MRIQVEFNRLYEIKEVYDPKNPEIHFEGMNKISN